MQINKFPKTLFQHYFNNVRTSLILLLSMDMIKHSQITQSYNFAIYLRHLKKELKNGGHFRHADKRQSFYKFVLSFWGKVTRHVQNTQNILRKNVATALCSVVR